MQYTKKCIDIATLKSIVGDNPTIIRKFLLMFLEEGKKIFREIEDAYISENLALVAALAHKFKSSSRSVGALDLGEIGQALEKANIKNNDLELNELLTRLKTELTAAESEILKIIATEDY